MFFILSLYHLSPMLKYNTHLVIVSTKTSFSLRFVNLWIMNPRIWSFCSVKADSASGNMSKIIAAINTKASNFREK